MERLPEEIREMIFDYVLRDNPFTLFSLRFISKEWKIFVDEYTSRFGEWFHVCKQKIPKHCFTEIVEKIAPLSAYPWQDSFWMRSRSSTVPKEVYHAWKNLPSLMLDNFQITEFRQNNFRPAVGSTSSTITIEDKYIVMSFEGNDNKTHIFDMQNLSAPIQTFDKFSVKTHFFTHASGTCRILVQLKDDFVLYLADFLANNELSPSGLHLMGIREEWLVVANELFIINHDLLSITHYTFDGDLFHESEKITLPFSPLFSSIFFDSLHINDDELRVLVSSRIVSGVRTDVGIYRYKISGDSSGKLSFTKDENNFLEVISSRSLDLSNPRAENAYLTIANIVYIKSASLLLTDKDKLYKAINRYNRRGVSVHQDSRRIWRTLATEISCAAYHSNYLVLGTYTGLLIIYEMSGIDDIVGSVEADAISPRYNVINLNASGLINVYIQYVGLKLRIVAHEFWFTFIIDFPGKDKKL